MRFVGIADLGLQMTFPFPGPAFVVRQLHDQTVSPAFGIVADEQPVPVPQRNDFRTRARIENVAVCHWRPGFTAVSRFALLEAFWRRTVVAHDGVKRAIASLHDAG